MIKYRLLLFAMLLLATTVKAQQGYVSAVLENYISEGVASNLSLKQEHLEVASAVQQLKQAKALFYPHLAFVPTYSMAVGGRRLAFPVGDMLNPAYEALNQLTGSDQFPTNIPNVNELLAPHNFHDTKVSYQYALYNSEIKYNYLIQKSLLSAREARLKVVEGELRFAIAEAYYQYLQALEVARVLESSRGVLEELVRLNTRLAANHIATKDIVFAAEYELSNLDKQKAEASRNVRTARSYFNYLLNRELDQPIRADTLLHLPAHTESGPAEGLPELVRQALEGRQEIAQLRYSSAAAAQAVSLQEKSAALPSLFVGGNLGFQGFGYRFTNQAYLITQVGLQWDLFKGYERKSRILQARIREDQVKVKQTEAERQIALQVAQASYNLEAARESLKATEAGVEKARSYFRLTDSRYRNQQVLHLEYLKAQNDVQSAMLQHTLARYQVLTHAAYLYHVLGIHL